MTPMTPRRHTVLVVDDEPEIVESLRRALRSEPYELVGTTSAREALETIEAGGIDLVVADIDMPDLNGLELVAKVRASRPDVVRVLLTGDASIESALEAINRGEVYRYLTKPWRNDVLREIIREGLARLDELRKVAAADRATRAREALLTALEAEHPGIRSVASTDGVHVLDVVRLRAVAADLTGFVAFFFRGGALDPEVDAPRRDA
jgi:two-component system probable response regulator PhcQ